jgi:hypothetical protein
MSPFDQPSVALFMRDVRAAFQKTSSCPAVDKFEETHREQVEASERAGDRRVAEKMAAIKPKDGASSAGERLCQNRSGPCPTSM